jgi:predicted NUDIX family NTP pyrophosphohydrolase
MVTSAGILLYRRGGAAHPDAALEVLIAHMGGPFWRGKDDAAWSIPKGEYDPAEEAPFDAARREFEEELGQPAPDVDYRLLGEFRQRSGKVVTVFAAAADLDVTTVTSNTFPLEWPPRSGRLLEFPEIDEARWVTIETARAKLVVGQIPALDALARLVDEPTGE